MTRSSAPLIVAVGLGAMLTACSPGAFTDRFEDRYATYADFTADAGAAFDDTDWIPADSTRLASVSRENGEGRMLSFSSATGVDPAVCIAGPLTGEPYFEANWWPSGEPVDGAVCGEWQVFASGTTWYGWAE